MCVILIAHESGRRKPEVQKNNQFEVKADMVIKALGFDPEDLPNLFGSKNLSITKWGTLKTNFDTMETNLPGVFAAGDIIRGASLVVWAIKDGRDAAKQIEKYPPRTGGLRCVQRPGCKVLLPGPREQPKLQSGRARSARPGHRRSGEFGAPLSYL